jgi:hypothetical protein
MLGSSWRRPRAPISLRCRSPPGAARALTALDVAEGLFDVLDGNVFGLPDVLPSVMPSLSKSW